VLGLLGGWVHWKRDRKSFWYLGTFMFTLTLLLIWYLNFKYGYSQCAAMGNPPGVPCEVRDRDYFFIASFSAWGVWVALGLVWVWGYLAALVGSEGVKRGREYFTIATRNGWLAVSPMLLIAFVPLAMNWTAASRAGQTDTRDFAHDLLNSVEPYGILVTVGDNDTFPLWYAQEVEGIRKDVVVANTSLLNTDWYVRQLIERPVYPYDSLAGPAIYRGHAWPKPNGSPLHLTIDAANALPPSVEITQPQLFKAGSLTATIRPQVLARADVVVLRMIRDAWPERPVYFSRTAGGYPEDLGLESHLLTQGLARKLLPEEPVASKDTVPIPGQGMLDVKTSAWLWEHDFLAPASLARRTMWVDRASVGIPYLYLASGVTLADAEQAASGNDNDKDATRILAQVQAIAKATGLQSLFTAPTEPTVPLQPESNTTKLLDTTKPKPKPTTP